MQFLFAPLWGRWSDRVGRKPLVLIGIAGFAIALFGLANSPWLFYGARIIGGLLSAAMFPAVTAYVADLTSEDERSSGMVYVSEMAISPVLAVVRFARSMPAAITLFAAGCLVWTLSEYMVNRFVLHDFVHGHRVHHADPGEPVTRYSGRYGYVSPSSM